MTFAHAVDRVQTDFLEMPGLELTMAQAVRLWHLGADDCRYVIDALVDAGFLTWTPQRTVVRIGRDLRGPASPHCHVRVRPRRNADKNVWRG
jgi:hypothetical protein